ncbi:ATP-binding protein [Vibrio nigripulchritudo]|uniref:ATP-binding protein n=1 Tax=Vibrio nigripulchritudo TaxID=28173 RepID=UPI0005F9EC34|nr:ATP-binding protein [Vibrio nigripulchritudo]KJY80854.1 histidine kinase [Vibrio nigripulchritudo]
MDSRLELLEKKLLREIAARKHAEKLLEEKSVEMYNLNKQLDESLQQVKAQSDAQMRKKVFQEQISRILIRYGRQFLKHAPDEVILNSLIKELCDSDLVVNAKLILLKKDTLALSSAEYGELDFSVIPVQVIENAEKVWDGCGVLWWPLMAEGIMVGTLAVKPEQSTDDREWFEHQITLLSELVSSAISRQLILRKTIDARERAEASERSTRDFLAMINHELRTPLNGLLGTLELLSDTSLTNEQKRMLNTLEQSGQFLRVIIDDLLDYSKINAGMMQLSERAFRWSDIQTTLQSIFINLAKEKRIEFRIENFDSVPNVLVGDVERVKQIFVNLIGNAIKFTQSGHVTVNASWQSNWLTFYVQDTGCGIAEEDQENLFNPFTQADISSKRNHGGTGLGLAICKQLVAMMQGSITLKSKPDEGTRFDVSLRLSEGVIQDVEQEKLDNLAEDEMLDSLKILVVEDLRVNQFVIQKMLKKLGITPDFANNGEEGVEAVSSHHYDLVFMDCRMPVMDGFDATLTLRERNIRVPIVALTAGTTLAEREKCLQVGMNDILNKPYTSADLKDVLVKWGL